MVNEYEFVKYEKRGHVAIVTMDRQERLNSLSKELTRDMNAVFEEFEFDDDIRVVILTGNGRFFSSGADVKDWAAEKRNPPADPHAAKIEASRNNRFGFYQRMREGKILKPLIAAVNGPGTGAGAFLALRCDLVVMAESAYFELRETQMGLNDTAGKPYAEWGMPFHLAMELSLGFKVSAKRAAEMGLINRVVPDDCVMTAALEMAEHMVELPPLALKYNVEGLRRVQLSHLIPTSVTLVGHPTLGNLGDTEDRHEATRAFNEKRRPVFKGR